MRPVVWLLLVTGCNQIYGLGPTSFVEAPIDAPYACPMIGTAPEFSVVIHQVITQNCNHYGVSPSGGLGVAICNGGVAGGVVSTGPIDGPMIPTAGIPGPAVNESLFGARLSPEGDRIYVRSQDFQSAATRLKVYSRQADDTWTAEPDLPIATTFSEFPVVVGITRRPFAHLLLIVGSQLREYVSDDMGGWTAQTPYASSELGDITVYDGASTEDGLRMIVHGAPLAATGNRAEYYLDRTDLMSRFRPAMQVDTLPVDLTDPLMTSDCGRVYFSGFGSVFYIQQR